MNWVVSRSWVRYGVWVMVGLWLKWVVGRWRLPVFMSSEVMVRLAWVTVMGLVEIGVGHHMVGWFFSVLPFRWFFFFFFFFFLIWIFVPVGFLWAVVAWWAWWRCGGGDWTMEARR